MLHRLDLPTRLPASCQPDRLLERMRLDKKSVSGQLRLILWTALGAADIVAGVDESRILAELENDMARPT